MRLYIICGDEIAERVAGNLCNLSTFCQACSLACPYCRSTYGSFAQQIKKSRISQIEDTVAVAHHAYPCTPSMDIDPEFNEPILHVAGYNIREAVKEAIERARKRRKLET